VALEITGGISGQLDLEAIEIRTDHPDYVFAGQSNVTNAIDLAGGRLASSLEGDGVQVTGTGYLATFIFQPSGGAYGVFDVMVKSGTDVLILNDRDGLQRSADPGGTELIGIGVDCFIDLDCDDSNDCTIDTCTSYVCTNDNVSQGTPCDDGLFCTPTDECDVNGICVGSGVACPKLYSCDEAGDQCMPPAQQ